MSKQLFLSVLFFVAALAGCSGGQAPVGKACLGDNGDSLVESMGDQCRAGDIVGTKDPAYFCNFNYSVAFNGYNSAFCVYVGSKRETRAK